MPEVKDGESEADYVARCVPIVMGEGKTQDQALGQCYGMYRTAKGHAKAKAHEDLQKERPA